MLKVMLTSVAERGREIYRNNKLAIPVVILQKHFFYGIYLFSEFNCCAMNKSGESQLSKNQ